MPDANTRVNFPFGDAFIVGTPNIDRLSQNLYLEQRQRELQRKKDAADLDNEFSKNVAAIRSPDVGKLTELYTDWKMASQQAMKKKGGVSPEEQMKLLQKKGAMYKWVALSKENMPEESQLGKDIGLHPYDYDDNASRLLAKRMGLSSDQLESYKDEKGNPINLKDYNTYLSKRTNTDFGKAVADAYGTEDERVLSKQERKDGTTFITPVYKYGKSPLEVKERLIGNFATRQAGRDAERQWDSIPEDEKKSTIIAFNAMPLEKWQRMGLDGPQDLTPKNPDSKAEKLASLLAMQKALATEPKEGRPVTRDDKQAIDERNFQQQLQLAKTHHDYRMGELDHADTLKGMNDAQKNVWIGGYLDDETNKARTGINGVKKPMSFYGTGEAATAGNEIPLSATLLKAFTKDGKSPDKLIVTFDDKYVPIFYRRDKEGNLLNAKDQKVEDVKGDDKEAAINRTPAIIKAYSVPQDRNSTIIDMGGQAGVKQKNLEGAALQGGTPPPKGEKPPAVSIPSGTMDEWLKTPGWDKDKIQKAVKAGKIKIR
jgi:hypothetical protein